MWKFLNAQGRGRGRACVSVCVHRLSSITESLTPAHVYLTRLPWHWLNSSPPPLAPLNPCYPWQARTCGGEVCKYLNTGGQTGGSFIKTTPSFLMKWRAWIQSVTHTKHPIDGRYDDRKQAFTWLLLLLLMICKILLLFCRSTHNLSSANKHFLCLFL